MSFVNIVTRTMAKKLNARPIISEGIPGVMNLKMIHAADPEIIALKAAGVFALGHHIPAVNGINSPTNRILKESRSRVYTSPMYKATNMEKIAKIGTDSLVHLRIFLSEKVLPVKGSRFFPKTLEQARIELSALLMTAAKRALMKKIAKVGDKYSMANLGTTNSGLSNPGSKMLPAMPINTGNIPKLK